MTQSKSASKPESSFTSFLVKLALFVLVLRSFVFAPFSIPSESMLPRLLIGDYLIVAKWPYGFTHYSIPFSPPLWSGRLFGRDPERRTQFVDALGHEVTAEVVGVEAPQAAIESADVVATMTSSATPVFDGAWLKPGTHVNAAGSNHLRRREIDGTTVRRAARIVADSVEQARVESGDLAAAVAEGLAEWRSVLELTDVVCGNTPGRTEPDQITLFESHGLAAWDVATAAALYELALERGLGQTAPLWASRA